MREKMTVSAAGLEARRCSIVRASDMPVATGSTAADLARVMPARGGAGEGASGRWAAVGRAPQSLRRSRARALASCACGGGGVRAVVGGSVVAGRTFMRTDEPAALGCERGRCEGAVSGVGRRGERLRTPHLDGRDVAGSADAVCQPEVPASHQRTDDTAFSLSRACVSGCVVAVHRCGATQQVLDPGLRPWLLRDPPLRQQLPHLPLATIGAAFRLLHVRFAHQISRQLRKPGVHRRTRFVS